MPETYKPGSRQRKYSQNHQISENRYAWVQCELGKFLILVGEEGKSGSDVVIFKPQPGKLPDVAWNLSLLTEQELDALEELIKTAFEWARPVVQRRDKEAKDAWDNGDDSYTRSYRAVPTVVYRKRPVSEHGEGVRERPESVPAGGGGERADHPGRVRGAGDELAEPDSDDGSTEDDGPSTD